MGLTWNARLADEIARDRNVLGMLFIVLEVDELRAWLL